MAGARSLFKKHHLCRTHWTLPSGLVWHPSLSRQGPLMQLMKVCLGLELQQCALHIQNFPSTCFLWVAESPDKHHACSAIFSFSAKLKNMQELLLQPPVRPWGWFTWNFPISMEDYSWAKVIRINVNNAKICKLKKVLKSTSWNEFITLKKKNDHKPHPSSSAY